MEQRGVQIVIALMKEKMMPEKSGKGWGGDGKSEEESDGGKKIWIQ